jgi:hypothetical protein
MRADVKSTIREFEILEAAKIDFNYKPSDRLFKPILEGVFSVEQALRQCDLIRKPKGAKATLSDAELKSHLDILLEAFQIFDTDRAKRKEAEKSNKPAQPAPLLDLIDNV